MLTRRRTTKRPTDDSEVASVERVKADLRSLHDHCLTDLGIGLVAMTQGDLTVEVRPATKPISTTNVNHSALELVELFNSMLTVVQATLTDYNALREQLRSALGDQSCLEALRARLRSLDEHCLTGLGRGLGAAAEGDLTIDVQPVTKPIEAASDQSIENWAKCSTPCLPRPKADWPGTTQCVLV